jgi:hypothetical protein
VSRASETPSEEAVRRELWISFVSLIRSYVAAAQIGADLAEVLVAQSSEHELELVSKARTVRLTLDEGSAAGYWVMHLGAAVDDTLLAEGAFRIGMDSLVEWTGLPGRQEMDAVAEALATLILE